MIVDHNNINIPDYMNFEFFQTVLKNGFKNETIQLKNVFFTMGPKMGENYCSDIFRASATYNNGERSDRTIALIVKRLPETAMGEHCKASGMFPHERDIYVEALSNIANILGGEHMAPRFLYFASEPVETIVFEDVTPLGYLLADRSKGLDEEHCALVFRKLAKYHAASMELARKNPEIFAKYKKDAFTESGDGQHGIKYGLKHNFSHLAKVCATWPGFEKIAEKLEKIVPKVGENFYKWMAPTDDEMKVLIHNDLWTNNILFKYNDGKLEDLYFIDFQATVYSSPGSDICHFLYTSPQFEVLNKKRDHIIKEYYYKTFKETLEGLGYTPVPSLADILKEINNREICGFSWAAVTKLFVICMNPEESGDNSIDNLSDPVKGPKIRDIGMSMPRFVVTMQHILRHMDKIGALDGMMI